MGLDQSQTKENKADARAEESGKALVHEIQDAEQKAAVGKQSPASESPKPAKQPDNAMALDTGSKAQEALALRAVAKEKNISTQAIPKYDGSVLDAISSAVSKATSLTGVANFLAYANPFTAGISMGSKLVKVAENIYQSSDKKLTVSKLFGQEAAKIKDDWDKMFESDKPSNSAKSATASSLEFNNIFEAQPASTVERVSSVDDTSSLPADMMHWLFNENEKPKNVSTSDNLFSYTDEKRERTEITALPGHVHIEKRDEAGNIKTVVDKSNGNTMVLHGNESVIIENGKQIVKGDGYTVSWDEQGKRHVSLSNGQEVVRDGQSVKLIDKTSTLQISKHYLDNIAGHFSYTDNSADDLARLTEEKRQQLKPGETYMLAIKGSGLRTIFQNGTTFDVRHNQARLETPEHKVYKFQIQDDKLFLVQDGELLALDGKDSPIKAENGKFKIGELLIDPRELRVQTGCDEEAKVCRPGAFNLDLRNGMQEWFTHAGDKVVAQVNQDDSTKIIDGNKTFQNNNFDSKVSISTAPAPADSKELGKPQDAARPEVVTVDLSDTKVETKTFVDEIEKTTIRNTNTVINKDRTVDFENGPKVKPDGTVHVDKNTYVTNDLKVHSNGWESTAAQAKTPISETHAQTVAMNISNKASSIYNLAKAGVVRWTEVAALNAALGDVMNLLGSVPPGSPAHAALLNSYALIVEAINIATPKAQLAENAMEKGADGKLASRAAREGLSPDEIMRRAS